MRAIVNAMLSYGLVTVPVGVCTSAKRKESEFRTLHRVCGQPINVQSICRHCGEVVEDSALKVRGFEFVKNQFVEIEDEELESIAAPKSKIIKIDKFVPAGDFSSLVVEKNYWLSPNMAVASAYALLARAITETDAVAIGRAALWQNEYPVGIWVSTTGHLVMSMLFCADELVSPDDEAFPELDKDELEMAYQFVALKSDRLSPDDLVSPSRQRKEALIQAKVSGAKVEPLPKESEPQVTLSIIESLRESIEAARVEREREKV